MFTYPLTLDSTGHLGTGLSKIFDILDFPTNGSLSGVTADALTAPRQMKISHSSSTRNGVVYNRHLVRLDMQETDATDGDVTASAYVVLDVPHLQTTITEYDVSNLVGQLIDMLTNAGAITKILGGES